MGKIIVYCRIDCHYSNNTKDVLNKLKDIYDIQINIVENNNDAKLSVLNKLKDLIGNHKTFPIVIYESSSDKQYFIGGNDMLMSLIQKSKELKNVPDLKSHILSLNDLDFGQKRLLYYLSKK